MKFNSIFLAGILSLSHSTAGEFTTYRNGQGIDLFFDYTGEVISNVSGGDKTGTGYNGLASFGIEADLGQALGWEGVTMRLSGIDLHGSGIDSHVGDMMGVSNIEGYGSVRLYESWVEKLFAAETLSLRAGLLLADEEFSTFDTTGPWPSIEVDVELMHQVLSNVFLNAVEAMDGYGELRIEVSGTRLDGRPAVRIVVEDTGEGMTREELEQARTPFFTTRAWGTGLGLALCDSIVEAHGGTMGLASVPGDGTRVTVVLPEEFDATASGRWRPRD